MSNLVNAKDNTSVPLRPLNKVSLVAYRKTASDAVNNQLDNQQFRPSFGKTALVCRPDGLLEAVLVGIDTSSQDPRSTLQLFSRLCEALPPRTFHLDESSWQSFNQEQIALGWGLASYRFDFYKKKEKSRVWPSLYVGDPDIYRRVNHQLASVFFARDLVNIPAGDLGPEELCEQASKLATSLGARMELVTGEDLKQEYPAIHAVGKGSHRPSALIDMHWGSERHPKVTLVGKGVVFDSGGLDIKPAAGMLLMKKDMGGAAVVLGLARLIMASNLKLRLRVLIPVVENAVSAQAYHPGDVVKTRKGLTVEVGNTDAEGRLILCDALADAVSEEPDLILDMATLTGACRVALGQDLAGFYTPNDQLASALERAAKEVADPVWRMPLWMPYSKSLKSKIADLNNIANTPMGGSITAALFLHEFVKPFQNWLHFDIYAWRMDAIPGTPKGGEATALRAIFQFLENRFSDH